MAFINGSPVLPQGIELSTFIGMPSVVQIDSDLLSGYLHNLSENVAILYNATDDDVTLFVKM